MSHTVAPVTAVDLSLRYLLPRQMQSLQGERRMFGLKDEYRRLLAEKDLRKRVLGVF